MGFNPYRKLVIRRSDYILLAATALVAVALLGWAFLG